MLDCIFTVLYLRSYSPNSSRVMRSTKTGQICFEKRTSTIPSLLASSRRDISAQLIRVTGCEELEFHLEVVPRIFIGKTLAQDRRAG